VEDRFVGNNLFIFYDVPIYVDAMDNMLSTNGHGTRLLVIQTIISGRIHTKLDLRFVVRQLNVLVSAVVVKR
jgi:hypothetical protein